MAPHKIPDSFSKITINGEEYMPTPHELNPEIPEDQVWTSVPPDPKYLNDPEWYNDMGEDQITQRRIWGKPTDPEQIDAFKRLLHDFPNRALDMMFEAATKGKPEIVRSLLGEGIKGTMIESEGDNRTLVPLHAAAYQGKLDCVKVLIETGKLDPNTRDEVDGTPLMRACWGNRPEVAKFLLDVGASIDIKEKHPQVVQYLLKDLDVPKDVQETEAREGNEKGQTALEFAAASGSEACVQLISDHAFATGHPFTPLTYISVLSYAAQSDDPDMLAFLLRKSDCPIQTSNGEWSGDMDVAHLHDDFKGAIENSFRMALLLNKYKSISFIYPYMDTIVLSREYHFTRSKDEILDAVVSCLLSTSEHDDPENINAFNFLYDISFSKDAHFTTPKLQEQKSSILGDALYWAAQHGSLNMIKAIAAKHPDPDLSHLSRRVQPYRSSVLYTAAGMGHNHVVNYLFDNYGSKLPVQWSVGKFANGATPLHIAVQNGCIDTVKTMLARGGGPVESIDKTARPSKLGPKRIVLTATRGYRMPVRILAMETAQKEMDMRDLGRYDRGKDVDRDGNELSFVVLQVDEEDLTWWDDLQYRESDEVLLGWEPRDGPDARGLKEKPAESESEERPQKRPRLEGQGG